ncbi:MAG TPA: molybdenum cofactor biosynthesis protein MoaE [Allosphingosinicella sp.]|uniref:molybdenum cofactor biosynthesis protein MoaE n=1 Tax=Allosphingosinicella sp. TaxID=2823234 RepID=UPI002ED87738
MIRVQEEPFDPAAETASLALRSGNAGAVATFIGIVRGANEEAAVTRLHLDHYPGFTESVIGRMAAEAEARFPLLALAVVHRYGDLGPGEPIVFVGAAAEHRRAALEAVDYLMDRLKTEAPFWKREDGPTGFRWIEPREADHADRARWTSEGSEDARD